MGCASYSPQNSLVDFSVCMCVCAHIHACMHTHMPVWLFIQDRYSGTGLLLLTQMKGNLYQGEILAYLYQGNMVNRHFAEF